MCFQMCYMCFYNSLGVSAHEHISYFSHGNMVGVCNRFNVSALTILVNEIKGNPKASCFAHAPMNVTT